MIYINAAFLCQGYDERFVRIDFDGMEGGNFNK
jgi:hypothetical protein